MPDQVTEIFCARRFPYAIFSIRSLVKMDMAMWIKESLWPLVEWAVLH